MSPHVRLDAPRLPRPAAGRPWPYRAEQRRARVLGWLFGLVALAAALTLAGLLMDSWSRRAPVIAPRHRAEALCFALAQPPAFEPPMQVEPSAALVRGRFAADTPPGFALQETMHFEDSHVLKQWTERVGDYEVSGFWLRLPGDENDHWLVLAWMEDADLAVCNFRFSGTSAALSPEERAWGVRVLQRVLVPENFVRGSLPAVTLRAVDGSTMPTFGPVAAKKP